MSEESTNSQNGLTRGAPRRLGGILAATGHGIVVTGSVIGSGELINTPVQAARFGFVLLWAVIVSCIIKYFLQVEIGRHALVHQRTPFEALNALPGPRWRGTSWIGPIFVLGSVLTAASLAGILSATAGLFHSVMPIGSNVSRSAEIWSVVVYLVAVVLLWRGSYRSMERLITVLVGIFSLSVVAGLVLIQGTDFRITAEQVFSGLKFSFGDHDRKLAAVAVVSLLGALGATGNELFMYPYWILEKGYGRFIGSPDSAGWNDRVRGWIRVLQVDVLICTGLALITTLGYFLIGAAVLYGQGEPPSGLGIVERLSTIYTSTYGPWSKHVFLLGALCTLFSTLIVGTAAFARTWCDMFVSFGWIDRANESRRRNCVRVVETIYLTAYLGITVFYGKHPEKLVIFGQYISGLLGTPLLMFAICWMAFRTDPQARMGKVTAVLLVISVVVISACVIGSLILQSV